MDAEFLPCARSPDGTLALRPMTVDDRDPLLRWRNLPQVARHMYTEHEISADEHAAWFERALADLTRRYWIIVADGSDVGLANLYDISMTHRRCSWAFYIGDAGVRGKGIGTFVEYSVLSSVFDRLELNRLCCEVLAENEPVWRMHLKCGFMLEGKYRRHIRKGTSYHDVIALAMLRDDWHGIKRMLMQKLVDRGLSLVA